MTEDKKSHDLVVADNSDFSALLDTARFEHVQRIGKLFANSDLVPAHFRGKEANCIIAISMALRAGVDPFMMMQGLYVVHGRPGLETKLALTLAEKARVFKGPVDYRLEGEGNSRKCVAFATMRETGKQVEAECSMGLVKAEGWIDKPGSKWKTMPDMMLQYRAAMFLIRLYAPWVLFGMMSREEAEDVGDTIDVTPMPSGINIKKPEPKEKEKEPKLTKGQVALENIFKDAAYSDAIEMAETDGKIVVDHILNYSDKEARDAIAIIESYKELEKEPADDLKD